MERAGLVATEALLVTFVHRFLSAKFQNVSVIRGDGTVRFQFKSQPDGKVVEILEKLGGTILKDLTGRSHLATSIGDIDFGGLKNKTKSFTGYMGSSKASLQLGGPDFDQLPDTPGVARMLSHLYRDLNQESTEQQCVTDFPKAMCATGARADIVLGKNNVVSVYSDIVAENDEMGLERDSMASGAFEGRSAALVQVDTSALAKILAPYSEAPVEQHLPAQWRSKSFTLDEAKEVLTAQVYEGLKKYWNNGTHTEKVKVNATSLLAIVSGDCREYVREQILLESSDLVGPWRMQRGVLENGLQVCQLWQRLAKQLVTGEWMDWEGDTNYRDEAFDAFVERLASVVRIRTLTDHAVTLLSSSALSQQTLSDGNPETIFENLSLTDSKHTTGEKWFNAVAKFDTQFSLIESSLAGRLRGVLSEQQGDNLVRMAEQFELLIHREAVHGSVESELQRAATYITEAMGSAQKHYGAQVAGDNSALTSVSAAHALDTAISPLLKSAGKILKGTGHLAAIEEKGKAMHTQVSEKSGSASSGWVNDAESRVEALHNIRDAVVISVRRSTGLLHVAINRTIIDIINEVNEMKAQGGVSHLAHSAERTLSTAQDLYSRSLRLQQIVSAFNTVTKQILPSTKTVLDSGLDRCRGIIIAGYNPDAETNKHEIVFGQPAELDSLIPRFLGAVESVSRDNRRVRRFHQQLTSSVIGLFDVDLHTQMDIWKNTRTELKSKMETFEREMGCVGKTEQLRKHWDQQLYKALEHQYVRGLETLNESVSTFKVDLIFKQGQVQFKPGFEKLREMYYTKIKEFINIPLNYGGLGDSECFTLMAARNAQGIARVHTKAMELFNQVNKIRKQFREFVVIGVCGTNGAPDLDFLVEMMVQDLDGWDKGLKLTKDKMRKSLKIEETVEVDCITISTAPIKASIDDQLHKLEEALASSLRRTAQKKLEGLDEFVFFASNIIDHQPNSLEEVGKANKAYTEFKEQLPDQEAKLEELKEMNRLLKSATGASIDLGITQSRWDHLMDAMSSHHKQIDASVQKMRSSIDAMIQRYLKDLQRFANNWNQGKPVDVKHFKTRQEFIEKGLNYVKDSHAEFQDLWTQGKEMEERCDYFKIRPPDMTLLEKTNDDVNTNLTTWQQYEVFEEEFGKLRVEDWLTFRGRTYSFEDFCKTWRDKADDMPESVVTKYLKTSIETWLNAYPLLKFVRGEGYLHEHWSEQFRLLGIEKGMTSDKLTFGDIIDQHADLVKNEKELKHLHARAQGEVQIRDALQDLRTWAMESNFNLVAPSGTDGPPRIMLITEWKDVLTQVSDNQALLNSLKDSVYFARFADEAGAWDTKLVNVGQYLALMNQIQRKWVYLEPLFARGALPHEQPRFKRVDKEFVLIMKEVESDPRIMSLAQHDYAEKLKSILEQIDRCQKALNEFLEEKRDKFARFYFISDEDLLEILGQSKNPAVIQAHLKKLFMGINSVRFDEGKTNITHMISGDGEVVELHASVDITASQNVEDWLILLDDMMRVTLRDLLARCVKGGDATPLDTVNFYPSQILQVSEQVFFCRLVEQALPTGNLSGVKQALETKLNSLTSYDITVSNVLELKVKALILDVIHSIEVVDLLMAKGTTTLGDWWWAKQLRYYANEADGTCICNMTDTSFKYTFEYQGNALKLVHTPLTDKCYLTLCKGMDLGYGGNPYGPAGTGKTESIKALGSAMGRQVLVFNCDEGIDFKAMGRIFMGIVKCGAWGCFDEFNRLKVDQLSAISQLIQVIQEALKNNEPSAVLLGKTVDVSQDSGIFVTMNPAGKGYGGRSELPDNLKQLFRAIAMSAPDNNLITQTMLLSEGFQHAKTLAKKVVEVYKLSKQLLSLQKHYDWGLRPLKAVLRLGGTLVQGKRKAAAAAGNPHPTRTEAEEAELMVQSLRVNTLSKLTFDDARLFNGIVSDIFPGVPTNEISYADVEAAIAKAIVELKLQTIDSQIRKILQLYEALNQRMGVVLVGPSGSGKSTLLNILRKALQLLGVEVPMHVMNPKAIPRQQLLGYMDVDTREWFDGVLSAAARKVVKEPQEVRSWIFCDGDIDPEWVESLNSVLDDNKLLTMPNGVRIQFGNNINFVFETHSLEHASPATVSRMGIIFLSEADVHPQSVVTSFLNTVPSERRDELQNHIESMLFSAVDEVIKSEGAIVETTKTALIKSALVHVRDTTNKADFASALIHGLGTTLGTKEHREVATKILVNAGERAIDSHNPVETYYDRENGSMASFTTNSGGGDAGITFADLSDDSSCKMVMTSGVRRTLHTLQPLIKSGDPIFLVGPEGCGKSMVLGNCFADHPGIRVATIHCNAQTSAAQVRSKLNQMFATHNTNEGRLLKPKEGDRVVLVMKDLNLPKPDKYATVQLHSFLQQLLLYDGFYDDELEWIRVEKLQLVGSMNPAPSAGRFPVASRLLAIVNVVSMSYPEKNQMMEIYSSYFRALLTAPGLDNDRRDGKDLATMATTVYEKLRRRFDGSDYAHCIFCPRDVTTWVRGVLSYNLEKVDLAEALSNEANRIFSDRLHKPEDRSKAEKLFSEQLATVGYTTPVPGKEGEKLYVSWESEWIGEGSKVLSPCEPSDAKKQIKEAIMKYARECKDLNITLIPEVIQWIGRCDRALARPGGHVLLIGLAGVGRVQALTIAAYMLRIEVVSLSMSRDYALKHFKNDLKAVINKAAIQNERVALVVEDHNITNNAYLEMLNSLISCGEVPSLYTNEELEVVISPLKEEAASEDWPGSTYSFFLRRIVRNLRVCLVMDPTNELFASRCQSNPALLTKTTLMWMGAWSADGMKAMCHNLLKDVLRALDKDESYKGFRLSNEMIEIHKGVERATPHMFRQFLMGYMSIYNTKSKSGGDGLSRLEAGLTKLREAEQQVDKIKVEVTKKKADCEKKQVEADDAMTEITASMAASTEQRSEAEELTVKLADEQVFIVEKTAKVESELGEILPALEEAKTAVSGIKAENLNDIRVLRQPPEPIKDVLEGVLALLGVNDVSWQAMKKFLGERGVVNRIVEFDAKLVTSDIRRNVEKLLHSKANSFKPEVIQRASSAAAPLAVWVKAITQYAVVIERIGPLQRSLDDLTDNKAKGDAKLKSLKHELKKIDVKVDALRKEFSAKCKEAERLKDQLEKAETQLIAAQDLLSKLEGEKVRWSEQTNEIRADLQAMPRKALLAAGFMSYLVKHPEDVRASAINGWNERAKAGAFNFSTFMRAESQLLNFKAEGLPGDQLSMENAVSMLDSIGTSLVIDPANQAIDWLKKNLKGKEVTVEVASLGDERFAHTLELAIRFGKTLLVTEVDKVEPMLFPVLRKDLVSLGPKKVVQLGSKQVDWQENFRIFLLTRSTDLALPPDSAALLSEVNFSVTRSGLESQMLGLTIQHERPELEEQKVALLEKEEGLKMQLAKLEESLLYDLAHSHGDLLENTTLISSLNQIKTQAMEIHESLAHSRTLAIELDEKREVYRPVAYKGSIVFFLVQEMELLQRMYQFSLADFLDIFKAVLSQYDGPADMETKIPTLALMMCQRSVLHVTRGLFKRDRVPFGMNVVQGFFPKDFPLTLWDVLVGKSTAAAAAAGQGYDHLGLPGWASPAIGAALAGVNAVDAEFLGRINIHDGVWQQAVTHEKPETLLTDRVAPMDLLLAIQAIRKDRLVATMTIVAQDKLRLASLTSVTTIESLLPLTRPEQPILLVTSTGADPSIEVQEVAYQTVGRDRFTQVALGGGQTDEALLQVRRCAGSGGWVFLKNLHLVLDWAYVLEKEVLSMTNPHEDFRLWITTESHPLFPSVLLKSSLKMTIEAPPGAKQNLLRTYGSWTPQWLSERTPQQAAILYAVAWFHATCQERRSYLPQGWLKYYEYNQADLKSAVDILMATTANNKQPDWAMVQGMFESAIYGGRLEFDQDVKVLNAFLRRVFTPNFVAGKMQLYKDGPTVPSHNNHDQVTNFIKQMNDVDAPNLFLLPENADRVVLENMATAFAHNLKAMRTTATIAGGGQAWKSILAPVLEAFETANLALGDNAPTYSENPDPLEVFFVSEINLIRQLIKTVIGFRDQIKRVSEGSQLASADFIRLSKPMLDGTPPDPWLDRMDACQSSFVGWLGVLMKKQTAVKRWFELLQGGALLSEKLHLAELLRPHTFLNAFRQFTARKTGDQLVHLTLGAFTNAPLPSGALVVTLDGSTLQLQGAQCLQGGALGKVDNTAPSSVSYTDIKLAWIKPQDMVKSGVVAIPLYANQNRELHILDVCVPCQESEVDEWVMSSTALFLDENI